MTASSSRVSASPRAVSDSCHEFRSYGCSPPSQSGSGRQTSVTVSMGPCCSELMLTRHNDVLVMSHQIFDDSKWTSFDVGISPVDPTMVWPQCGTQQPVS